VADRGPDQPPLFRGHVHFGNFLSLLCAETGKIGFPSTGGPGSTRLGYVFAGRARNFDVLETLILGFTFVSNYPPLVASTAGSIPNLGYKCIQTALMYVTFLDTKNMLFWIPNKIARQNEIDCAAAAVGGS